MLPRSFSFSRSCFVVFGELRCDLFVDVDEFFLCEDSSGVVVSVSVVVESVGDEVLSIGVSDAVILDVLSEWSGSDACPS